MNALALGVAVVAAITFGSVDAARADGRASTCADVFKAFREATEYAGMWRLNDLERTVAQVCPGDSAKAAEVQQSLRRVQTELETPGCRRGQGLLDNSWYFDEKEGARALNASGTSKQRKAIAEIEANCAPAVSAAARRRWPMPFANRDADEAAQRKATTARQSELDRQAAQETKLREPITVADLVKALDGNDGARFEALLDSKRGTNLLLDNGNRAQRIDLVQCFNTVVTYRRERGSCGKVEWVDASCPRRVFVEGKWRDATGATSKYPRFNVTSGSCGFDYPAFEAEVATDVAVVERYERRLASFQKDSSLAAQRSAAMDQLARSASQKQPDVVRAGVSDNLCSVYSQLDDIEKHEVLQRKIDQESGTVDLKVRRSLATAKVLLGEQMAKAKKQWGLVGGKASDGRQSTSKFWCGLPRQTSVLDSARQTQLRSLGAKRMPAAKTCGSPDWKELALATNGSEVFRTCTIENIANQKEPVPEPIWEWLREAKSTGEEFIYTLPIGDSVSHMVFQYASSKWTLLRTEVCGWGSGSGCDELADFEVQPVPKSP